MYMTDKLIALNVFPASKYPRKLVEESIFEVSPTVKIISAVESVVIPLGTKSICYSAGRLDTPNVLGVVAS